MAVVGLTGGIASGKSTVARLFRSKGAVILDADQAARDALAPGKPALRQVLERFGNGILTDQGDIDRAVLADLVFSDREAREDLERIVHPEIFRILSERIAAAPSDSIVVIEAALLIETLEKWKGDLKPAVLIVVSSRPEDQLKRLIADRGLTRPEARARIDTQGPWAEKLEAADYVLSNTGSKEDLERAAGAVWDELENRFSGRGRRGI